MDELESVIAYVCAAHALVFFALGYARVAREQGGPLALAAGMRCLVAVGRATSAGIASAWRAGARWIARVWRSCGPLWGPRGAAVHPVLRVPLLFHRLPLLIVARWSARERIRRIGERLVELDGSARPRWLEAAGSRLREELERYGIRDAFQVRLGRGGQDVLGFYVCFSQFEGGQPVLTLTHLLVQYVRRCHDESRGDHRVLTVRDLAPTAIYVLAHEYAHSIVELSRVICALDAPRDVGASALAARKLCELVAGWREGPRGKEEAFCDDVATFLRTDGPCFLDDASESDREETGPLVRSALRMHAQLVAAIDADGWARLRDLVRIRFLGGPPALGAILPPPRSGITRDGGEARVRFAA